MGARAAGARTAASGVAAVFLSGAGLAACTCGHLGATDGGGGTGADGGGGLGADAGSGPGGDAAEPPQLVSVYTHSADTLYRVDPDTLTVSAPPSR